MPSSGWKIKVALYLSHPSQLIDGYAPPPPLDKTLPPNNINYLTFWNEYIMIQLLCLCPSHSIPCAKTAAQVINSLFVLQAKFVLIGISISYIPWNRRPAASTSTEMAEDIGDGVEWLMTTMAVIINGLEAVGGHRTWFRCCGGDFMCSEWQMDVVCQ
jgi:hypothetical protein